jgi:catechol 2,3-dioxygenase-like lactoylglutathione lyase family enzyme
MYTLPMIRQIAPLFFTTDIPRTLAWYNDKLGFDCLGTWQDPPVYAIVARDQHAIHFRCAEPPAALLTKSPGRKIVATL